MNRKRKIIIGVIIFFICLILIIFSKNIYYYFDSIINSSNETNKKIQQANADNSLEFPTAYNTSEVTHPSVVYFKEKWNGYHYWMAVTPYPKADATMENPHIFASNDMITWVKPKGIKNPIDEIRDPNDKGKYNSDTHLIYNNKTKELEVFFRSVIHKKVYLYRSTSKNGSTWSKKQLIFQIQDRWKTDMYSPAIIFDNNKYQMWYVSTDYNVYYRESADALKWSKERKIAVNFSLPNTYSWHLDVQKINGRYEMLINAFTTENVNPTYKDRRNMSLYFGTSKNNIEYTIFDKVIAPSDSFEKWDQQGLYRSSFIKKDNEYIVFYSGIAQDGTRGVGISKGNDMKNLKGYNKVK